MLYQVQRQRTAGAYITIKTCESHEQAVDYLGSIAAEHPDYPYNGGDKWQDSKNVHNVNRYRIVQLVL